MGNKLLLAGIILSFAVCAVGQTQKLTSPNGKIAVTLGINKNGASYQISYEKKAVILNSKLQLTVDGKTFFKNTKLLKPILKDTTEEYDLLIGRASHVTTHYKEVIIPIQQKDAPHTKVNLVFRAFDEGIAFRYEFVSSDKPTFLVQDESDEFNIVGNPTAKVLMLPNFTSSHEGHYTTTSFQDLPSETLMDIPALFQIPAGPFVSITEAALLDYAGMYLVKENGILKSKLSPLPNDKSILVKGTFPHKSPWRVILISNTFGDFLSSNMLTTLSPPSRIKDVSWIKPGKTTFPWWNGNVVPDTLNAPGNNFVTQKYFIDFCKRAGIAYHTVVEYGLHQWYVDDGVGFQPGPNSDVTTAVPGLDMKEVCDYAHSQGVGVRVWVQWAALYPKLDAAFEKFEQWGLSGMMIDFMDRDDQEMVNIQNEMLEKAAKHHLHIQFHGSYKPTGLNRTYPNEFTREGTLNYEVNKWSEGLSPEHDLDIAFTRLIAGSTDYHMGGFRAVPDSMYRTQYTRPLMHGTRCHMLGMYVILENALGMVSDYPEAYEGEPGFDFVKQVPTTWDETKVIKASMGEYLIIARRKGTDWYLGAINNSFGREVEIPLSFLSKGTLNAIMSTDTEDARKYPNKINRAEKRVDGTGNLKLKLAAGGGAAIHFKKIGE